MLGIVGHCKSATDVEILELPGARTLYFAFQLKQPAETDFVRLELRDLGSNVHVETDQRDVLHRKRSLGDNQRLIEGNSKLHSLDAGPSVGMWRVHHHL